MTPAWLVDGMNVIGSRPDGWWRDRAAAQRALVDDLAAFAARTGDPVAVIFDGRPFELEPPPGVEVAFARRRGPNAADDDIAARAEGHENPAELTVVTSDRALADRVRSAGANVVAARGFRDELTPRTG